jgi:hypothetical protein
MPWTLGDLALEVETSYGEDKLGQFADDIGVPYTSMDEYRRISAAYKNPVRTGNLSWSVYKIFAAQENRAELIKERRWTAEPVTREGELIPMCAASGRAA